METATCTFNEQDILDTHDGFTAEDAKRFMIQNRKYIEEAMCRAGFEAIEVLWVE